jgi:glutathione S-transferase
LTRPFALELFGANTGNSFRAAIALEEAELPYAAKLVQLRSGEHRAPNFMSLNPAAKVPVLVDHGQADEPFVLTQSNAIMMYAVDLGSPDRLLPEDGQERVRALKRYFYFVTDTIAWSATAIHLKNRGHATAGETLEVSIIDRLEASERFLEGGAYMAGNSFSLADIAGFTIILAYRSRIEWRPDQALVEWFERVAARPGIQKGLAAFRQG